MWTKIRALFSDSETIAWARLQMFIGAIAEVITYVDPTMLAPIIPSEWFPLFVFLNGLATEFLRRRRDPALYSRSGG